MFLTSWIESLCLSSSDCAAFVRRRGRADRAGRRVAPTAPIELLEQRTLLTVTVLLVGNTLDILADGTDTVIVRANAGGQVEVLDQSGLLASAPAVNAVDVQALVITGSDSDNVVDLSGVTAAQFTTLASILVSASDGDDLITGSPDLADSLSGGDGNDTIAGDGGNDTLDGGNGDDSITGDADDDSLLGGDGRDAIDGGDGDDTVLAGNGNDTVSTGDGADSVFAGNGEDSVLGGAGSDTLNGDGGVDTVSGDDGDDAILGGELNDSLLGGTGNDTLNGQGGNDTIDGETGDDSLLGGAGQDLLQGGNGNDVVNGNAGNDTLAGGSGNDRLLGGSENDLIHDDFTSGGNTFAGFDTLLGQGGDDSLFALGGADSLDGGTGNDLVQSLNAAPPTFSVSDITLNAEGDSGTTATVTFTITLSQPATGIEQITYATADGTATATPLASADYVATSGAATFAVGQTTLNVMVTVNGDTRIEGDEYFFLNLTNPFGATLGVTRAFCIITDDDPLRLFDVIAGGGGSINQLDPPARPSSVFRRRSRPATGRMAWPMTATACSI